MFCWSVVHQRGNGIPLFIYLDTVRSRGSATVEDSLYVSRAICDVNRPLRRMKEHGGGDGRIRRRRRRWRQRQRRQDPTMKAAGSDDEGDGGAGDSGDCGIRRWRIGSRSLHGGIRDTPLLDEVVVFQLVQL